MAPGAHHTITHHPAKAAMLSNWIKSCNLICFSSPIFRSSCCNLKQSSWEKKRPEKSFAPIQHYHISLASSPVCLHSRYADVTERRQSRSDGWCWTWQQTKQTFFVPLYSSGVYKGMWSISIQQWRFGSFSGSHMQSRLRTRLAIKLFIEIFIKACTS